MDQIKRIYERLSWTQRIWLVVAVLAVGGAMAALSHWNQERDFKPLYTDLSGEDAGSLVTKLKETGVEYRLADNGTSILVPSEKVAEARIALAVAGLPKSGRIGFELFDKANFGASDFTEQVNYHRAIEGELERSVMSIREVEQARVHITMAKDSLYTESRQPAKASVLVKLRPGARLSAQNVAAICQLTASAVPELAVEQVSLVDTNGTLLNRPRKSGAGDGSEGSEAALEYRKSVEKELQNKIAATLEPLLGLEHFRAGVSAEVDLASADQSEEIYDPQKTAVLTSQKTEDGPALPNASGVPGTASSLPRPTSTAGAAAAGTSGAGTSGIGTSGIGTTVAAAGASRYARKTESVSYQPSRVVKHTKIPQGSVTKLSLSVLVDHGLRWQGAKRIVEPPSPEKLKVIHDLVAAAVGLNTARGDQLVVEAFPFEATLTAEPPILAAPPAPPDSFLPPWLQKLMGTKNFALLAGIGAAAMLLLLGGTGWLLASRGSGKRKLTAEAATAAVSGARAKELGGLSPEEMQRQIEAHMAEQAALQAKQEAEELMKLRFPAVSTKKTEVLTKHITAEAKKDPALMAQVVRSWLNGQDRR